MDNKKIFKNIYFFFWHSYEYGTLSQGFQNDTLNIATCVKKDVSQMDVEQSADKNTSKNLSFLGLIWWGQLKID